MRLLIIEDEQRISDLVGEALRQAGFVVDAVFTAADGEAAVRANVYDAVVLDLGLPDGDGLRLLADLDRRPDKPPVLVLTARDSVEDRVAGLDAGADDYLVKPFAMIELVARVKALLRRPGGALGLRLEAGNVAFDTVGRDVQVAGLPLPLARQELAILEHLMRRLGRVAPKAVLEDKLYGMGEELESNAIPVHVHHLRRKLLEAGADCAIHTVRGVGYFLEAG
ncbi:response regulator transcription factor [Caulobacter sp. S45]|uniref:response regulator n=1 Tax=Caulobacter sp. S45 TaxID=1641861 RepID=UPI00131C15C1|nr:response regulator transcription factor [Caulobacter sp. S45]